MCRKEVPVSGASPFHQCHYLKTLTVELIRCLRVVEERSSTRRSICC
jgi:hypothetical protein